MDDEPGRIVRIAARGDGVTRDGRHVPLTAPGDLVGADGAVVAGPHHVAPPCRHFPVCGGCRLQHLDEVALATFVARRVTDALAGQGIVAGHVHPAHVSPPFTRRRVTLHALRVGAGVVIGFNEAGSHHLIDLAQCAVMHPALFALMPPLRALMSHVLPLRRRGDLSLALVDQGVDLLLRNVAVDGLMAQQLLTDFARDHHIARVAVDQGHGVETLWEPVPVTVSLSAVPVPYPPHGFLQATRDGETALIAAVGGFVAGAEAIADLFAGLGTFALALPARRVLAAEADRAATVALRAGATAAGRPVAIQHRDLFRRPLEAAELNAFAAVVLDPPRAGAREQVARLAASSVPRLAYVSCNPSSFARDAAVLVAGGYRLSALWPVGQFRWSSHVELVGGFIRS